MKSPMPSPILSYRRLASSALCWLLLQALVGAQVGPGPRAKGVLTPPPRSPLVTIGDGVTSRGMFEGSDQMPFLAALAALPQGGSLLVGQGDYVFSAPVPITADDVSIRGSGATLHASPDVDVGIFDVQASGLSLSGLRFADAAPSSDHALLSVSGHELRIQDCAFTGGDPQGAAPKFLELVGVDPSRKQESTWITRNLFHPRSGWTCVEARDSFGLHITSNSFLPETQLGPPSSMRYGLFFHDVEFVEVRGNFFTSLGDGTVPIEAVVYVENDEVEGHHLIFADNEIHTLDTRRALHLRGAHYNVISGNSFGRMLGEDLIAIIDIEDSDSSTLADSRGTTIEGNEFHNWGLGPAIRFNGGGEHLVTSNHFTMAAWTCIQSGDIDKSSGLCIASNQLSGLGAATGMPAILLNGGRDHVVHGNTVRNFVQGAVSVLVADPLDAVVMDNFEF